MSRDIIFEMFETVSMNQYSGCCCCCFHFMLVELECRKMDNNHLHNVLLSSSALKFMFFPFVFLYLIHRATKEDHQQN